MGFGLPWSVPVGGDGGSSSAFFAGMRFAGIFIVTDPLFGAVGDGVHADRPAIVAADAAARAFGNVAATTAGAVVYFPNPPVAYMTDQELVPAQGTRWIGEAVSKGECAIRASVAMRSVVAAHSTNDANNPRPVAVEGLTLDANGLALYALLRNSDWLSNYSRVFAINAVLDCIHAVGHRLPAVLGPVVPAEGNLSPLITISQPDPSYTTLQGVTQIIVMVAPGGVAYFASFDNGTTFATVSQPIASTSNLAVTSSSSYLTVSGIQIHFPAGAYNPGDIWSFTVTVPNEDGGSAAAVNVEARLDLCWSETCGYTYITGTVSTVAGSNIIKGTGNWLSGTPAGAPPRPGDTMFIAGVGNIVIAGVLDDATIMTANGDAVKATVVGAAYSLCVGFGYYEQEGGDDVRNVINGGVIRNCINGARLVGDIGGGVTMRDIRIEAPVGNGAELVIGGIGTSARSMLFESIELKPPGANAVVAYVMPNIQCTMIEPRQALDPTKIAGPGNVLLIQNGSQYTYGRFGISTLVDVSSLALTQSAAPLTSALQVLSAPDVFGPQPLHTSYLVLTPNADYSLGNAPTIAPPKRSGQVLIVENHVNATFAVTLSDTSLVGGSGLNLQGPQLVLLPGERVTFLATGSVFAPIWVQHGPVSRVFSGPADLGSASADDGGSGIAQTIDATVQTIITWPITFNPTQGFAVKANVSAMQVGGAPRGMWLGCTAAVDSTGALIAQFIPATNATGAYGTNAGLPPAGWTPSFAVAGGKLRLQVATGAAITARWLAKAEMLSCMRT